jgi:Xaa-Pro aminopeptidase
VWMIVHTGADNPGWGPPRWFYRADNAKNRRLEAGDLILAEIFPFVGQEQAEAQMCIALGSVHDDYRRAADVARTSYEIGLETLRPGARFGDVATAMERPLQNAGAWHLTPLIHSMNPMDLVGAVTVGIDNIPGIRQRFKDLSEGPQPTRPDVVLEPGMCFQVQPNAGFGRHRVNIGGNVIVTEDGVEELNRLPCRLRTVGC